MSRIHGFDRFGDIDRIDNMSPDSDPVIQEDRNTRVLGCTPEGPDHEPWMVDQMLSGSLE